MNFTSNSNQNSNLIIINTMETPLGKECHLIENGNSIEYKEKRENHKNLIGLNENCGILDSTNLNLSIGKDDKQTLTFNQKKPLFKVMNHGDFINYAGNDEILFLDNHSLNICSHNNEKHYAKNLCKQCYQQYYFQKKSNINVKDIETFFDFKKRLYSNKTKMKSSNSIKSTSSKNLEISTGIK